MSPATRIHPGLGLFYPRTVLTANLTGIQNHTIITTLRKMALIRPDSLGEHPSSSIK